MPDNIYKFRRNKWADPKRLKLIAHSKPSWLGSRYLSGFIVLCALVGFVAVQAWPKLRPETAKPAAVANSLSVRVIDGDTISLQDGKSRSSRRAVKVTRLTQLGHGGLSQ